jgi:ketosteroid isomerase-like protein
MYGKSIVASLLLMVLAACQSEQAPVDMTELKEFARGYAAAWSGQDPAALAAHYAEDGILQINDGEAAVGRDAVEATARAFMEAFPDMVVELHRLELSGEYVNFHWHWTGTNTGSGGTGAAVDLYGYEQWTFTDDGLIQQSLGHYDEVEYEQQLQSGTEETSSPESD